MVRIFKHYIAFSLVFLGILEPIIFFLALPIGRYINPHDGGSITYYTELVFTLVVVLTMAASGLYSRQVRDNFKGILFRIILVTFIVFFLMIYLQPALFTARTTFIYALMILAGTLVVTRSILYLTVEKEFFKKRAIVFGAGKKASHMNELRRKSDRRNFLIRRQLSCPV